MPAPHEWVSILAFKSPKNNTSIFNAKDDVVEVRRKSHLSWLCPNRQGLIGLSTSQALVRVPIAVIKHCDQKQLGEKEFILA